MATKFGLGKGLADLQAAAGAAPEIAALAGASDRVVVRPIPIQQIGVNHDQPRKTFAQAELEELAQSIREHGVLQPIIVRTVAGAPHLYEIVAGERRWRASQLAGEHTIPALVKPIDESAAMEIALIENVQRENLNAVEECDAYRNIMDKCNYAMSDLTKLIGKSESYIRNILRLKSLPDNVKEMVKSGEITSSHARTLAASGNAEEIARRIADEKLSVAEVSNLVRAGPRAETAQRSARKKIHYPTDEARKIELEIERKLQVRAKLAFRAGGKGTLQLAFENSAQMELLVATLTAEVESNM